jgi:hypothetical protein
MGWDEAPPTKDELNSWADAPPSADELMAIRGPMKSFKDVDWKAAIADELMAPFTGMRAGRPVPDSVNAATKSMGIASTASVPTTAAGTGLIDKAMSAAKTVKDNAVPLYVLRSLYKDAKGLLGGGH